MKNIQRLERGLEKNPHRARISEANRAVALSPPQSTARLASLAVFFFKLLFLSFAVSPLFWPFSPTAEPGARLTADLLPHKNLPLITMAADIFRQAIVVTTEAVTQCKAKEACV